MSLASSLDGADEGLALEDLGNVLGLGGNVGAGHLVLLEELLGGGGSTEGVDTVLSVRVLGPAERRVALRPRGWAARREDRETVVDGLGVEDEKHGIETTRALMPFC